MTKFIFFYSIAIISVFTLSSCGDTSSMTDAPKVIFKFKFSPNQERLGNFGEPAIIPAGNAAQTPDFNSMGVHYIELAEKDDIPAYNGTLVHNTPVTTKGGGEAINFDQALYAGDNETFFTTELENISPGTFEYLRLSLSYQNYAIKFEANDIELTGTIASFIGANTYIDSYTVNNQSVAVNANKAQGYWAFETDFPGIPLIEGQAPAGATTVPNPIFDSSPIPFGSCLVTGQFDTPLIITGDEKEDIIITCSVSINNSFEWIDNDNNGKYNPQNGDAVVNMGVRGLIPSFE